MNQSPFHRGRVGVTGVAGFIGSHLAEALLGQGWEVVGIDAFTDDYPAADKWSNLAGPLEQPGFELLRADLATGDVHHTGADGTRAQVLVGYRPETDLAADLAAEAAWMADGRRPVGAQRSA